MVEDFLRLQVKDGCPLTRKCVRATNRLQTDPRQIFSYISVKTCGATQHNHVFKYVKATGAYIYTKTADCGMQKPFSPKP